LQLVNNAVLLIPLVQSLINVLLQVMKWDPSRRWSRAFSLSRCERVQALAVFNFGSLPGKMSVGVCDMVHDDMQYARYHAL